MDEKIKNISTVGLLLICNYIDLIIFGLLKDTINCIINTLNHVTPSAICPYGKEACQ
jgi:hypothetical protein